MTFFSSTKFANFVSNLSEEKIIAIAKGLKLHLRDSEHTSRVAAVSVSVNADVIKAVKERNTKEIIKVLTPLLELYNVDYCTATDESGIVLARTHATDRFDDSILGQQNVINALKGKVSTYYEEGTVVKVSIRTGSPIYDMDGTLIGVISTGVRLDTNKAVDELKEYFGSDFTVFFGDTRVATTITRDGERITGTQLDPKIAKIVLEGKKEYFGNADILGENYSTFYMPLINSQNEVFAILFVGNSNAHLISAEYKLIINGIIIGLVGLVISAAILALIIGKITKPINRLVHLVSDVTHGNVDVVIDRTHVTKDEIGDLILNVYSLFDVIKSITHDLQRLIHEMNTFGKIDFQVDTRKYSGINQKIVEGIQTLADSVLDMNKIVTVMDSLDSMIIVVDLDYNLVYVNRSLADAYGLDRKNCIGKKCYDVLRHYNQPCSLCQLPDILPLKDSFPSLNYEFLYDEYLDEWLSGKTSIIRWIDGSMVYFQTLNIETEKKKNQEQLSEALKTAELASIVKSTFLANMSHELRTPLNVVISLADLQLEDDKLPEEIRENLRKISNAGNTLLSIVNDILDISKIESGKFTLMPVEYHMASLLNDTIALITSYIGEKPIAFCLNINDDLPSKLYGDDLRVKQILNNLLSNAIKYTLAGTVELGVHCEREGDDVWMNITVKDTGIGIRPEDLKKLFSDYNQVDVQANRKIKGTGLGLPITKKLVENMDGEISVESEYDKGSVFRVRIRQGFVTDTTIGPVVVENLRQFRYNENKRHFVSTLVRADLSYAKVLVVDDLQANLEVAAGLMRKYKMQVDCVTSGQVAIERIKLGKPVYNAIFMDHMMPEMDGIEAADKIRELGTDYARTIPIIALTANAVVGTEELFYKHDFQAFITKPIDIMRLDSVIQQWIKNKSDNNLLDGLPKNSDVSETSGHDVFPEEENPTMDISGIDTEKGLLICGGDWKIYQSVLRSYVADTSTLLGKMRDVTEETLPGYAISVHGIKGASANIGAEKVRKAAANLEAMAKDGDLSEVLAQNDAFLKEAECLVTAIKDWLEKRTDKITKPRLSAPDQALLARLRQSCEQYDFDGADKIMGDLESANYEKDADLMTWLREKINNFDLNEVAKRLADYESDQEHADVNQEHEDVGQDAGANTLNLRRDRKSSEEFARQRIILVDDSMTDLTYGMNILKTFYKVYPVSSAARLFETLEDVLPDLILLDIEMPEMNGYEVIKKLKADARFADIPVIFLTSKSDESSELEGFNLGATDYISKPFSGPLLLKRIAKELLIVRQKKDLLANQEDLKDYANNLDKKVHEKTAEVFDLQNAILATVADLVEFRDELTGGHIARTKLYLKALVEELLRRGIYAEEVSKWNMAFFLQSAQLHDVGKIHISDLILNKPDKLTSEEFEIMKTHVTTGVDAIEKIMSNTGEQDFLRHTLYIAGTHHEKWDGTGYPVGLKGLDIPLEGRLMAIADVYDALISERPYKKAFTHEEACKVIEEGSGTHFDPALVDAFRGVADEFARIAQEINQDPILEPFTN